MERLKNWLQDNRIDPDLQEVLLSHLNGWRYNSDDNLLVPYDLKLLFDQLNAIGWNSFLEGWIGIEWEATQQAYYNLTRSKKSGKRWFVSLIKKMWEVAWDLWEHRNGIAHSKDHAESEE
jgi:hypothetical protein